MSYYRFDEFRLDVANRRLWRGDEVVDLNARYFDALALLVREPGQLIEKERFFDEVWSGVPVTDSALTQCVKEIRRVLGDSVANPRYVETVPRYGYRFVGELSAPGSAQAPEEVEPLRRHDPWRIIVAGTLGGGAAGIMGGLLYGSALVASPDLAIGAASMLVVMIALNMMVGVAGGFGVSAGFAAVAKALGGGSPWTIGGAAAGGLAIGSVARLLGLDAFTLLFGQAPSGITGGLEGAVLGGALALGLLIGLRVQRRWWEPVLGAGVASAIAGAVIPLAGGRLMGGSLELLSQSFAGSRLQLDSMGRWFGEVHFGRLTETVLGGIEGLLFGTGVAAALLLAGGIGRRRAGSGSDSSSSDGE